MKTGRLEAIAKGLSLRAPLKTPALPRPRSTLMNALSRFFVGVSTLFCLVVLCPSTGFAVSANASPTATFGFTTSTQDVTISDRSYCEEGETECECPNGYVVSGTVKRKKYQVSGSARPECSYSGEDSSTSTIDTRLTPDVSSLSSCERDNVTSMSCGPITLSDDYIGQCITLNYSAECTAIAQCYTDTTESYYTCKDSDSASGSKTISIPPSIDGVQIYMEAPCLESDDPYCILDEENFKDMQHQGYQNGLRKNKTMSLNFYVYAAFRAGDYVRAVLSGAGVYKEDSGTLEEMPENRRIVFEFADVTPTKTENITFSLTVSRSGCSVSSSYSIPVKADYCTYPIDENTVDACNLDYYFYNPDAGCKDIEYEELDAGEIEDIDSNYNEDDLDYDAGIVEDFDAGMDWDAGVGLEELDANLDFDANLDIDANISIDAGEIDAQIPDIPDFDAGLIDFDGGAFSSGNGDPNNGGENSGQGGNGGSGSGSDAGSGSGGSSDSDAGFTGGIGLPSVDEFVDGGTGEGSGDGSGSGSDSGDEGPDSEFTGGDTGFSGGASGDLGDSSADGSGNGNGSGSGNGSGTGTGTGGSGNGSGSGGQGSGEAPEGGTGFTGGTGFPGGAGFDGYDWGSGDSQGETTPSAPGSGDGSGSGSGNGSGTGDGSGSGSGNGSGTGDGSGSGSGNGSGTGDGSGSGSGNGSGTGDGSGNGSGNGSGTGDGSGNGSGNGDGSGNGSGNQQFSLTGGVQKESTVTGCGGCSGSGASFLLGWLGLALLPALRRRKRG